MHYCIWVTASSRACRERGSIGEAAWERGTAAAAVAALAPGVKKLRGGTRERSLSFIFVLMTTYHFWRARGWDGCSRCGCAGGCLMEPSRPVRERNQGMKTAGRMHGCAERIKTNKLSSVALFSPHCRSAVCSVNYNEARTRADAVTSSSSATTGCIAIPYTGRHRNYLVSSSSAC
jgi:hypothetical protein